MGGGERSDSPWLRAAMLTPSVRSFMTATRVGAVDPRWQYDLLHKPSQSLVMTFSADPHLGMVADRFTGSAVVFLATATFSNTADDRVAALAAPRQFRGYGPGSRYVGRA